MTILLFEKTLFTIYSEKEEGLFTSMFMTNAKWSENPNSTTFVDE
jgi:hypothetical protein